MMSLLNYVLKLFIHVIGLILSLDVLSRFKIEFCVHISLYIMVNPFLKLGQIKFGYNSGKCQIVGFILNASKHTLT